ncbi:hypothetical protein M8C13_06945 [Crossiella sp. SN42]|nr:hypothetical protein [Crossiella sp. SN42]MCO1575493.1 hypothetical protein [Crossiella sp. SN42]
MNELRRYWDVARLRRLHVNRVLVHAAHADWMAAVPLVLEYSPLTAS